MHDIINQTVWFVSCDFFILKIWGHDRTLGGPFHLPGEQIGLRVSPYDFLGPPHSAAWNTPFFTWNGHLRQWYMSVLVGVRFMIKDKKRHPEDLSHSRFWNNQICWVLALLAQDTVNWQSQKRGSLRQHWGAWGSPCCSRYHLGYQRKFS